VALIDAAIAAQGERVRGETMGVDVPGAPVFGRRVLVDHQGVVGAHRQDARHEVPAVAGDSAVGAPGRQPGYPVVGGHRDVDVRVRADFGVAQVLPGQHPVARGRAGEAHRGPEPGLTSRRLGRHGR
jgi:hypothetical protein